jgi:hypothetical protein
MDSRSLRSRVIRSSESETPISSSGTSSSIAINPTGRFSVIILSILGESGTLGVGVTGSEISGSSPVSLADEKLPASSETVTASGL